MLWTQQYLNPTACQAVKKKKTFRFLLFFTELSEREERTQEFSHFFASPRIWKELGRSKYDGIDGKEKDAKYV